MLGESNALVFKLRDLASSGNSLVLELLAGSGPCVVVLVSDVLELDSGVLEEEAVKILAQEACAVSRGCLLPYDLATTERANVEVMKNRKVSGHCVVVEVV